MQINNRTIFEIIGKMLPNQENSLGIGAYIPLLYSQVAVDIIYKLRAFPRTYRKGAIYTEQEFTASYFFIMD